MTVLSAADAADRADVEAATEQWVPQLSSKRPGTVSHGMTYDAAAIVADYRSDRGRYPQARLLYSGDWPVFDGSDYWVVVVATPFATAEEANAWCDAHAIATDDCLAKKLSHTNGSAGTTRHRP